MGKLAGTLDRKERNGMPVPFSDNDERFDECDRCLSCCLYTKEREITEIR